MSKPQTAVYKMPNHQEKIIVALDVATAGEAREIVAELQDIVGAFKIGLQLFTAAGASFVRELTSQNIRIFLDLKFHDIPNTVAAAGAEAAKLGVWMFNIHALGGSEMMSRTVEKVNEICTAENLCKPKIIGVTVLTSADATTLHEIGIEKEPLKQVLSLAEMTARCGLDGIVCSPQEVSAVREHIENKDFMLVTPGVRPSFATNDDQKRVMTPSEAIQIGSDFLVIGRPILQAANRREAVRKILSEIETLN